MVGDVPTDRYHSTKQVLDSATQIIPAGMKTCPLRPLDVVGTDLALPAPWNAGTSRCKKFRRARPSTTTTERSRRVGLFDFGHEPVRGGGGGARHHRRGGADVRVHESGRHLGDGRTARARLRRGARFHGGAAAALRRPVAGARGPPARLGGGVPRRRSTRDADARRANGDPLELRGARTRSTGRASLRRGQRISRTAASGSTARPSWNRCSAPAAWSRPTIAQTGPLVLYRQAARSGESIERERHGITTTAALGALWVTARRGPACRRHRCAAACRR